MYIYIYTPTYTHTHKHKHAYAQREWENTQDDHLLCPVPANPSPGN